MNADRYYLQYDDGRGWANKGWDDDRVALTDMAIDHRKRWPRDRLRILDHRGDVTVAMWESGIAIV